MQPSVECPACRRSHRSARWRPSRAANSRFAGDRGAVSATSKDRGTDGVRGGSGLILRSIHGTLGGPGRLAADPARIARVLALMYCDSIPPVIWRRALVHWTGPA